MLKGNQEKRNRLSLRRNFRQLRSKIMIFQLSFKLQRVMEMKRFKLKKKKRNLKRIRLNSQSQRELLLITSTRSPKLKAINSFSLTCQKINKKINKLRMIYNFNRLYLQEQYQQQQLFHRNIQVEVSFLLEMKTQSKKQLSHKFQENIHKVQRQSKFLMKR